MEDFNIEVSSTTLGNPSEKGSFAAIKGLAEKTLSNSLYTDIVARNAREFENITKEIIPDAEFGVSILASSVNPGQIEDLIKSIDYPYLVEFNRKFINEKVQKAESEGYTGLSKGIAIMKDLSYGLLQARSAEEQLGSTMEAANYINTSPIKIRTCTETISIEEEFKKIKDINRRLKDWGKSVTWVIEPNKKMGDKNVSDFLNRVYNISKFNDKLNFGIDLDLGGLPEEERNHLQILEKLNANELFPLYVSLSGREYRNGEVISHLPLRKDEDYNKAIGEWFKERLYKGQPVPGIVIETSPAEKPLLDYTEFLKAFGTGFY